MPGIGCALSFEEYNGAVIEAFIALTRVPFIPGIAGPVELTELARAAAGARTPYCAGDRSAAVEAVADVLTANWRQARHPETRRVALAEGEALLTWVESLSEPRARNSAETAGPAGDKAADGGAGSPRVRPGEGDEEIWIPPADDCMDRRHTPCPHCGSRVLHLRTSRCGECGRRPGA